MINARRRRWLKGRNATEAAFERWAECRGWFVSKRGWPDYFCVLPTGMVVVVEVKRRLRSDSRRHVVLRCEQARILNALAAVGIACYVSDGKGIEPFDVTKHADESRRTGNLRSGRLYWRRGEPTEGGH